MSVCLDWRANTQTTNPLLTEMCLVLCRYQPEQRATARALLNHPYFGDVRGLVRPLV
jgi:hypothetical protein